MAQNDNSAWHVVFSPEQNADGLWVSGTTFEFREIREFVDACMRPSAAGRYKELLISLPEIVLALIELMETRIVGPGERDEFLKARALQASLQDDVESLKKDQELNEAESRNLRWHLWHEAGTDKETTSARIEELNARWRDIRLRLREREIELDKAREAIRGFFRETSAQEHERIVNRLFREYKAWSRGALVVNFKVPVRRVHWEILKPSGNAWQELVRYFERLSHSHDKRYDLDRLHRIHDFEPDQIFVGRASFEGYVVFVFSNRQMAVLDCPEVGNALYMMETNKWKLLSQMSKTELLRFHREEIHRIVHVSWWLSDLKYFLESRTLR
jgi:hypothetical protein